MILAKVIVPVFAVVAAKAVSFSDRLSLATSTSYPSSASLCIAPATTLVTQEEINNYSDSALSDGVGDDSGSSPDEDDADWADEFMAGEPVDPNMDFWAADLIEGDISSNNSKPNATTLNARSYTIQNETVWNEIVTALVKRRLLYAFTFAHYRARLRQAGELPIGLPEAQDFTWAQEFFNGEPVDDDLIFNSTDLDAPDNDSSNDSTLFSYAGLGSDSVASSSSSPDDSDSDNRNSPSSAVNERRSFYHRDQQTGKSHQVVRRTMRSVRRARHRAMVARRQKARLRAAQRARRGKAKAHKNAAKAAKALKHAAHEQSKPNHKHHKCHAPPGYLCNGNIDCHWWCVRGVLNCGQLFADC